MTLQSVDSFQSVLDAFRHNGCAVDHTGDRADCQAPGHSPDDRSVSVSRGKGRTLIYSHAGEKTEDILREVGLKMRDLFDTPEISYDYPDGRVVHRTPDKRFSQSGVTDGNALYGPSGLPEDNTVPVYVVEGEQDADTLSMHGVCAVSAPMGAANVKRADWSPLYGRPVIAVVDQDDAGQQWAAHIRECLESRTDSLVFVQAKDGKDATDHITAGHTVDDFVPVAVQHRLPALGITLMSYADIGTLPKPVPLIDGLLYENTLAEVYGPTRSFKSFIALSWALSLATGTPVGPHDVPNPRPVLYIAAEGANGLHQRMSAWSEAYGVRLDSAPIRVVGEPVQLNMESMKLLADYLNHGSFRPGLVVFDTRARCTVGVDENSAKEIGNVVTAADHLRTETGATILTVHHTPESNSHKARGSNAYVSAIWSEFSVLRKNGKMSATVTTTKHKDLADGQVMRYDLQQMAASLAAFPHIGTEEAPDKRDKRDAVLASIPSEGEPKSTLVQRLREAGVKGSNAYNVINKWCESGIACVEGSGKAQIVKRI